MASATVGSRRLGTRSAPRHHVEALSRNAGPHARHRRPGVRRRVLRLGKETDIADFEPVLKLAAQLCASHAVVNGDEPDQGLLADVLARSCELGRAFGLTMNLEFTPWTGVRTPVDAIEVVDAAGRRAARVLIDAAA